MKELAKLGKLAERDLLQALAGKPSAEVQKRIEELFTQHRAGTWLPPEAHRAAGAIEVLGLLDTPAARKALEELARRAPGAYLCDKARAALRRLDDAKTEPRTKSPESRSPS
jgi:hypothetical protein